MNDWAEGVCPGGAAVLLPQEREFGWLQAYCTTCISAYGHEPYGAHW